MLFSSRFCFICLGLGLMLNNLGCLHSKDCREPEVKVFVSNDIRLMDVPSRKITLVLVNETAGSIFIPAPSFTVAFETSIEFEMMCLDTNEIITIPLIRSDEHFSPYYYEIRQGQSISHTIFVNTDVREDFYTTLSKSNKIRLRWYFHYYDCQGNEKSDSSVSRWMSKSDLKMINRIHYNEDSCKQPEFIEPTLDIYLDESLR